MENFNTDVPTYTRPCYTRFSYTENPMRLQKQKSAHCLYCPVKTSKVCQAPKKSYLDVNKMHR